MNAFTLESSAPARTAIKAVLIAGAGDVGLSGAIELLDDLPQLRCPIIVCVRDVEITSLQNRIDGVETRWAVDGGTIETASVWIAPPNRHTHVRNGRFRLSDSGDPSPAAAPSLGKLYHSLRVDFGSRVFALVIDAERSNTPQLRLLAQRGARVVSPLDCGPDAVATHCTPQSIVRHLQESLAVQPEAAVA